jgi:hypothetical protein
VLGLVLGGVLGMFDGLSALVSAPNDPASSGHRRHRDRIDGQGAADRRADRLVREADASRWARRSSSASRWARARLLRVADAECGGQPGYYWQIMLPGGILGVIVGYATFRSPASAPAPAVQHR